VTPLLRYEWRRAGLAAGLAAPLVLLLTVAFSALAKQTERLLLAGLEAVVPLALAMAAVSVVVRDSCRELHLALPVRHVITLGRRLGMIAGVAAVVCLFCTVLLVDTGPGWPGIVLVWAAPVVFMGGLAVLVTVATRSAAVAATVVGLLWLGEQVFAAALAVRAWPLFLFATTRGTDGHWLANRLVLLSAGALFLAAAAVLLARPERLLGEEDEQ
jgi:hypothetical protein